MVLRQLAERHPRIPTLFVVLCVLRQLELGSKWASGVTDGASSGQHRRSKL